MYVINQLSLGSRLGEAEAPAFPKMPMREILRQGWLLIAVLTAATGGAAWYIGKQQGRASAYGWETLVGAGLLLYGAYRAGKASAEGAGPSVVERAEVLVSEGKERMSLITSAVEQATTVETTG